MERRAWLLMTVLAMIAFVGCSSPSTSAKTVGGEMSGLHFDVHETPG